MTFEAAIDAEVAKRPLGKDAVPMKGGTERKFRAAATAFVAHRKSPNVATLTAKDVEAWKCAILQKGDISNNTVKQRIQNLRTVVEWAREQSLGELFPNANPLALVTLPAYRSVNSADRTYIMDEAKAVL